jgi:hypothetical protein
MGCMHPIVFLTSAFVRSVEAFFRCSVGKVKRAYAIQKRLIALNVGTLRFVPVLAQRPTRSFGKMQNHLYLETPILAHPTTKIVRKRFLDISKPCVL